MELLSRIYPEFYLKILDRILDRAIAWMQVNPKEFANYSDLLAIISNGI